MKQAAFVYADVLSRHVLREGHVMIPTRLRQTYELLDAYGAFQLPGASLSIPRQATAEEVLSFHTLEYLSAVRSLGRGEIRINPSHYNFSEDGDNPVYKGMYEAAIWSAGASLAASELLINKGFKTAMNLSGGLHHAMPGHASGFCIFNDVVIAIKWLARKGLKVAYVDIDCHHGDGVQHAFYATDQVLTISLHESGQFLFPGTGFPEEIGTGRGRGFSVNIPLYPYSGDETWLWALREIVPPLLEAFKPDVLVTQIGIDTHFDDPITHMQLTVQGFAQGVRELGALSTGKWLLVGGGGYDLSAVARGWSLAYGVLLEQEWPDKIPDSYRNRYGLNCLRDRQTPLIDSGITSKTRAFAESSVTTVQREVFPFHKLSGLA